MKKRGVSFIEVMIGTLIVAFLSLSLYYILSSSAQKNHIMQARNDLKRSSENTFKILKSDLEQAVRGSFKEGSPGSFQIEVRTEKNKTLPLSYSFQKPELYRKLGSQRWLVTDQLEELTFKDYGKAAPGTAAAKPGQIAVTAVFKANAAGFNEKNAPTLEQHQFLTIREEVTKDYDPHWVAVGDVDKIFNTDGSLTDSFKEFASALGNKASTSVESMINDIRAMTEGEFRQFVNNLEQAKNDALDAIKNLNETFEQTFSEDAAKKLVKGTMAFWKKSKKEVIDDLKAKFKSLTAEKIDRYAKYDEEGNITNLDETAKKLLGDSWDRLKDDGKDAFRNMIKSKSSVFIQLQEIEQDIQKANNARRS
ncbi:MAG: hypothetical protein GX221_04780 [Candidatus Riflebacteria bacterium]|nr:hypothetical protein [Candidatus Riflebacteria bacterium]